MHRRLAASILLLAAPGCFFTLEDDDTATVDGGSAVDALTDSPYETWIGVIEEHHVIVDNPASACSTTREATGSPTTFLCSECVWAFDLAVSAREAADTADACGDRADGGESTKTLATDGERLFYLRDGEWQSWGLVERWAPDGPSPNFEAGFTTSVDGMGLSETTLRVVAHVE